MFQTGTRLEYRTVFQCTKSEGEIQLHLDSVFVCCILPITSCIHPLISLAYFLFLVPLLLLDGCGKLHKARLLICKSPWPGRGLIRLQFAVRLASLLCTHFPTQTQHALAIYGVLVVWIGYVIGWVSYELLLHSLLLIRYFPAVRNSPEPSGEIEDQVGGRDKRKEMEEARLL